MEHSLTTSWLSARLGVEPLRLHVMRRSGQLLAFREPGSQEYRFPAWQFDDDWRPLPLVSPLLAAAREAGIGEDRLVELMGARVGIGGSERLLDLVRSGDEAGILAALRSAAPGP